MAEIKSNDRGTFKTMQSTAPSSASKPVFNPNSVPKPTNWSIEKTYGGTKNFMLSYGLRHYEQDDCDERRLILDGIKEDVWKHDVEVARREFNEKHGYPVEEEPSEWPEAQSGVEDMDLLGSGQRMEHFVGGFRIVDDDQEGAGCANDSHEQEVAAATQEDRDALDEELYGGIDDDHGHETEVGQTDYSGGIDADRDDDAWYDDLEHEHWLDDEEDPLAEAYDYDIDYDDLEYDL